MFQLPNKNGNLGANRPTGGSIPGVARVMVKVISRQAFAVIVPDPGKTLSDTVPRGTPYGSLYLTAYVREKLECGHSIDKYFIADVEPLTAKRRLCYECCAMKKRPAEVIQIDTRKPLRKSAVA